MAVFAYHGATACHQQSRTYYNCTVHYLEFNSIATDLTDGMAQEDNKATRDKPIDDIHSIAENT